MKLQAIIFTEILTGIENAEMLYFQTEMKTNEPIIPSTTIRQLYCIERKAICFFRFILEAYDGIAILETIDPKTGLIALHIAPGCEEMVDGIIEDLSVDYLVESL